MRPLKGTALALYAMALPCSASMAADTITVPTSSPGALPIHDQGGFDWSGFYAGILGGLQSSPSSGTKLGLGIQAGVNTQFDFYLLGAEVAVQGLAGSVDNSSYGQILGRAGLVVMDDAAIYAAGGYGMDLGAPAEQDVLLGGGVELAISESLSLRAQYLHGFPIEGGNPKEQITIGASFHF